MSADIDSIDIDAPYPLAAADLEFFRVNGFIKLKHVLSPREIDRYGPKITGLTIARSAQNEPLEARDTYGKAFLQVMNLCEVSPVVNELVMSKRLGRIAAELLEVDGVRLYHDQALYKEPGGGITPAHADQYFWPLSSDRTVTAWIPLQAVPRELGPLAFFAGSQAEKFGRDLPISDESEHEVNRAMSARGFPIVDETFELGEVSFHLGWTFHRAGPNTSPRPRSVLTIIYMDQGIKLLAPTHAYQHENRDLWCPGARVGEMIATPRNPVVYSL